MRRTGKRWKRRATTWSVGFFSLGALLLLGADWMFPAPHQAHPSGLRRWLALRDVSAQPEAIQRALVNRIQADITPEQLLGSEYLSPNLWTRLLLPQVERNIACLQRVWFETRCAQYAEVVAAERMDFLQAQVDFLLAWTHRMPAGEGEVKSSRGSGRFFDAVADWTSQASGEKRRQLERGIRDGVLCWLATTQVDELPRATRQQLANRLAEQLSRGGGANGGAGGMELALTAEQASRLQRNAWLLVETWIQERAREFAALPRSERDAYVDGRIDEVMSWNLSSHLGSLSGSHASSATSSSPAAVLGSAEAGSSEVNRDRATGEENFFVLGNAFPFAGTAGKLPAISGAQLGRLWQQATLWTERADPELRVEMEQLLRQVQWRLLARTLPRLGSGRGHQARSPSP